jgi:hypothetical protein
MLAESAAALDRSAKALETKAAARDQPHAVAVPPNAEAIAIVFHFVELIRAVGDDGRSGGEAKIK